MQGNNTMTDVEEVGKENATASVRHGIEPIFGDKSTTPTEQHKMATLDMFNKEEMFSTIAIDKNIVDGMGPSTSSYKREASVSFCEGDDFDELQLEIDELMARDEGVELANSLEEKCINTWDGGCGLGVDDEQMKGPLVDTSNKTIYSPKVFIGSLPADVTGAMIGEFFTQFGEMTVDWPRREYSFSNIPPNGYAFVVFKSARDVEKLVAKCTDNMGKLTIMFTKDGEPLKVVQVRPWKLNSQFCVCKRGPISMRYAIFVGGLPRTVTASQLAVVVYQTFGEVQAVNITVENGTHYPKGAARVIFGTREAYSKAVAAHFIKMRFAGLEKDVEMKPFLMDDVLCEGCRMVKTNSLCAELSCLLYLCNSCWQIHHSMRNFLHHTPMVKGKGKFAASSRAISKKKRFHGPAPPSGFPMQASPSRPSTFSNTPFTSGNGVSPDEMKSMIRFPPPTFPCPPPSIAYP